MHAHRLASFLGCGLLCCSLLAACGGDKAGAKSAQGEDGLPKPTVAGGSVTGMPDPGVAEARPVASASQQPDIIELPEPVDAGEIAPVDPAAPPMPIEGAPVLLPEPPPLVEDPYAPPPLPEEQATNRELDDPRQ